MKAPPNTSLKKQISSSSMRLLILASVCFFGILSHGQVASGEAASPRYLSDNKIREDFRSRIAEMVTETPSTSPDTLVKQLKRSYCNYSFLPPLMKAMTPPEQYKHCVNSAVMVSGAIRNPNPKDKKWYINIASGVIIDPKGVVLTNYHVMKNGLENARGIGVLLYDGRIYQVKEILAANEREDVALIQLDGVEADLPYSPLAVADVGDAASIIAHPGERFFFYSRGYVSRYFIDDWNKARTMHVTADFAKGSSGGAAFDDCGNVIGIVNSTSTYDYKNIELMTDSKTGSLRIATRKDTDKGAQTYRLSIGHQMVFKSLSPTDAVKDLAKKKAKKNKRKK